MSGKLTRDERAGAAGEASALPDPDELSVKTLGRFERPVAEPGSTGTGSSSRSKLAGRIGLEASTLLDGLRNHGGGGLQHPVGRPGGGGTGDEPGRCDLQEVRAARWRRAGAAPARADSNASRTMIILDTNILSELMRRAPRKLCCGG